nr:E3 ubiquitin-protein ligase RNF14 [Tanacetum cinerariifolium]
MLDSIWNEQHGLEVIYSWAEWLHTSAMSYLGFDKGIIIGSNGGKDHGDPRAISGCVSADVDIPSLKSYNEAQQLECFLTNMQECCICFSEFAGSEFIRLPCLHFFCENCMKTYTEVCIQEGNVNRHCCPIAKCGGMIPSGLIKGWLGDEQFEKWENLSLQKTLESMTDVAYCPRCELPCIEDGDRHAQCAKCFFSFCTLCKEKRHAGIKCATPEMKLHMLQERQSLMPMGHKQRMIQELLSVKEILRDAKQCPSCKMAISRTEGCNKMVCANCGTFFCYLCNKSIDGYDHFSDGTCELQQKPTQSSAMELVNMEEQRKSRKVERQILASLYPERSHTCRKCGQKNAKMGKNKLCWACEGRYCYLCREVVKRGSQRFGQKRCQHTLG